MPRIFHHNIFSHRTQFFTFPLLPTFLSSFTAPQPLASLCYPLYCPKFVKRQNWGSTPFPPYLLLSYLLLP